MCIIFGQNGKPLNAGILDFRSLTSSEWCVLLPLLHGWQVRAHDLRARALTDYCTLAACRTPLANHPRADGSRYARNSPLTRNHPHTHTDRRTFGQCARPLNSATVSGRASPESPTKSARPPECVVYFVCRARVRFFLKVCVCM